MKILKLFPAFAAAEPARLAALYRAGLKAIVIVVLPLALTAALFAPEWMDLWLGDEYARQGARVAQWLCLGVMLNCLAYLPFALLQARGRADLTAKAHLTELPLYLVALWLLVPAQGIVGAAIAWTLRCAVDAAVLFLLARARSEVGRSCPCQSPRRRPGTRLASALPARTALALHSSLVTPCPERPGAGRRPAR